MPFHPRRTAEIKDGRVTPNLTKYLGQLEHSALLVETSNGAAFCKMACSFHDTSEHPRRDSHSTAQRLPTRNDSKHPRKRRTRITVTLFMTPRPTPPSPWTGGCCPSQVQAHRGPRGCVREMLSPQVTSWTRPRNITLREKEPDG